MAEVLKQSQIDELLNRMRTGEVDKAEEQEKRKTKLYDFSSPKKFTKDQLKSLSNLHENFARILSSYFTGLLRNVCEVTILQIEEQRYSEFNNALPDNTLVGMIAFKPEAARYDESTLMIEFPTAFGFLLIDRMMGGVQPVYAPDRNYTEIEMSLLGLVIENVTRYMQEAWSNFFALKTSLRSIETNGRLLQAYAQQDVVVITTLEISCEAYRGNINICMPAENLEEIINSFSIKYARAVKQQDPEKETVKKQMVFSYLKQSGLTVEAVLEECRMHLNDIAMLQVNDVIVLNKKINTDISVNIEKIPWYTARLGKVDDKEALKIVDVLVK